VNVVSRSGGKSYHGNVFFFIRNEALNGRNAFATDTEKPPFRRKNSGATLGGPILRNRGESGAGVNYVLVRGSKLLRSQSINLGPPTVLTRENAAALGVAAPNPQRIGRIFFGAAPRRLSPPPITACS